MKVWKYLVFAITLGLFCAGTVYAQQAGDYRSAGNGNWSDAATWETFDGGSWSAAVSAPAGSENITVDGQDTVQVDVAVAISGQVVVMDNGVLAVSSGSLDFNDGSTYEHARDEGSIPTSNWNMGSTLLLSGITSSAPGNRNQSYYNIVLNTPGLSSNRDLGLNGVTIGGDIRVIDSGSSRWRLTSASAGDTSIVTIMGDMIVEAGSFETQGTGNALTTFIVEHYGNINVTGGTFAISRGSQGNGSGTTTWNLHAGDFTMSNAATRNSNPTPGNAKFVFASADTQQISFENVSYSGGDIHFKVASSAALQIAGDFQANGHFINEGNIEVLGTLTFIDGGVYDHARDGGDVPTATWEMGSTALFSGITSSAPGNRNQNYYNIVLNTPGLSSNRDLGLNGVTIGGDIRVVDSGSSRWRLTSASAGDTAIVTIMGDLIVEAGSFETQGTGNALTTFIVEHYGNINVTGGTFAISRGSQGSGSGTTTWNLHAGDFTLSNAATRNSNPTPGNAKFVFASADSQQISFENVSYSGGDIHFKVADSTKLQIVGDFPANGHFMNEGETEVLGTLTFIDGGVYDHARDGGDVPTATWEMGSTALFSGITSSAPGNRNQNYYNIVLNTPGLSSNRDLGLDDVTIGGDIRVIDTGGSRWRLTSASGGDTSIVTIMGNVHVEGGSFETQGTSNALTVFEVHHYGDVNVTGGTFAVSRGSQGNGSGSTRWFMHQGNFSISDGQTRNSNPTNAWFVFDSDTVQNISLTNVTYGGGGLPIGVAPGATLDFGNSEVEGNGLFTLNSGATLATANAAGVDSTLKTTGDITLHPGANISLNGTGAQVLGTLLPDSLGTLSVSNPAGIPVNDTLTCNNLVVLAGGVMIVDSLGSVKTDIGSISGTLVNKGDIEATDAITFEDGSVYDHARNEGSVPNGVWNMGSTTLFSGIVDAAPGNRNQSYYNIVLNTPNLSSNRDLGLDDVTIGGDIRVIDTGGSRWRLTSASGGDTAIVTIMGDVLVEGGSFETQGTSNALTVFEVHHYGDVNVTGGTFAVSRGSQGNGSGSTRWYMHTGNFSIADAQTRNSNPTNAWFVFNSDTVQTITLTNASYGGGGLPIVVASGATLDFGESEVEGNGRFTLNSGATLATANVAGVDSTLKTSGDIALSDSANYAFNGTAAQITGTALPGIVNDLTINNAAGVVLSQETTINGVLYLVAGLFDNTIPFTLGPNGSISFDGGTLLIPVGIEELPGELPRVFALYQNYPNPFNPSTTIRYDLPKSEYVTIRIYDVLGRVVAELVNDQFAAGAYSAVWDAQNMASGVYYYRITAGDFVSSKKLVLMK